MLVMGGNGWHRVNGLMSFLSKCTSHSNLLIESFVTAYNMYFFLRWLDVALLIKGAGFENKNLVRSQSSSFAKPKLSHMARFYFYWFLNRDRKVFIFK